MAGTEVVLQTQEQEERANLEEEERQVGGRDTWRHVTRDLQTAREMCRQLFADTRTVIRAADIPFQGWASGHVVTLMLEQVAGQVRLGILNFNILSNKYTIHDILRSCLLAPFPC